MNQFSVAHNNIKNQHSSWIDDPFDLKGFVTGVTKISDHQRNIRDYALEMVGSFGKFKEDYYELDFEMLSMPYQLELARLYIESIDREIEWACYGDDQTLNSDFLCALLAMFKDNTPKTRANFAKITLQNILIYYKETLQNLLNTACNEYYCNEMHESGYRAEYDLNHGDIIWKR